MVVTVGAATRSTIHHSPGGRWKEISLEGLTLGGCGVVCSLMTKKCSKCDEVKPLEGFHKNKKAKDGMQSQCKECGRQQCRQYYQANKEAKAEYNKQYRQANKAELDEHRKQYYDANRDALNKQKRQYYQINREAALKQKKQYGQANRGKIAQHMKKRYNTDPFFRLAHNIRVSIRKSLTNGGYCKNIKHR